MKVMRMAAFAVTSALAILAFGASAAVAAPPANDVIEGASAIGLGASVEADTSEATTDAQDAALNANCGAPATDASVWYSYTPASDGGAIVDVSQSSYSAGVLVGTGSPGALDLVTCGPGAVTFRASAGTTYYILAIDDQFDGGGNGGTLRLNLAEAPPPPTIDVRVDPIGTVNGKTGVATVSGTLTCSNADFVNVFTVLQQRIGVRATVTGFGGFFADGSQCDGTSHPWSADITPHGEKFAGGKSASFTFSFGCGRFECTSGFVEQTVKLRGRRH